MATVPHASDSAYEIELKLLVDEIRARAAWPNAVAAGLASEQPLPRLLTSTYYDTAGHHLRKAGIALRVRTDGERIAQTVKARACLHAGMSRAIEAESLLETAAPDPATIADGGLRRQIEALLEGRKLEPLFEAVVQRAEAEVHHDAGTRAMLAVDHATIVAGEARASFHEIEVELLSGPLGGLFDIARVLVPRGRVRLSQMSKAERGFLLAETGRLEPAPEPRFARQVKLARKSPPGEAMRQILRDCSAQVSANVDVVLAGDAPEGPHQLRIGLRRLRSALGMFCKGHDAAAGRKLSREARWLGREVSRLRDLQVIAASILPHLNGIHGGRPGFSLLAAGIEEMVSQARDSLCKVLEEDRTGNFLFELARYVEACEREIDSHNGPDAGPDQRFAHRAEDALDKRWRNVRKAARNIESLSVEQRHALRKELKKLRYVAEFFAPLFRPSRVKPFLKSLKQLQEIFGEMNDAAMLETRLRELPSGIAQQATVQFVAGLLTGMLLARSEMHWRDARARWLDLKKSRQFWK